MDQCPLGMDAAEWVSGAKLKPMAGMALPAEIASKHNHAIEPVTGKPAPPALFGALAELDEMRRSRAWAIGRAVTSPLRRLWKLFG